MKLTNQILKEGVSKYQLDFDKRVVALIASIFSVIFSLSIVFELKTVVDGYVLFFLGVFTVIFLITNERIKVQEFKKFTKGHKRSLVPFLFTFVISVVLSGVGIWFWTNKTLSKELSINTDKVTSIQEVKLKYSDKKEAILNSDYTQTSDYQILSNDLNFWKNKSSYTLVERTEKYNYIKEIESKIEQSKLSFNQKNDKLLADINQMEETELSLINDRVNGEKTNLDRNNAISMIFFIMIIITELGIIILNREIAEYEIKLNKLGESTIGVHYMVARKLLQSLYLLNNHGIVDLKTALYSPVLYKLKLDRDDKFNLVKKQYNLFIRLGILNEGEILNKIPTNKILLSEKEALNKFDLYYNKLLTL